jgi:hypothetical protein
MNFLDRMMPAADFEAEVMKRLNSSGWPAYAFGQAQLSQDCRERLKRFEDGSRRPSLIRWMPDIITFRDVASGRSYVALIDAKHCGDRPNYALEISAIETAEIYTNFLFTPTFFVFNNWKVLTPREARQRGRPGPDNNQGSGTPYVLIDKRHGRRFDEIFHPVKDIAQAS